MYKGLALYVIVLGGMGLAVWQPSLGWLSPVSLVVLIGGIIWLWRTEGYSVVDLGLRRVALWRRRIALGFLIGIILPMLLIAAQVGGGWITLTPATLSATDSVRVISLAVGKMALIAGIEEVVFRGYFLQRFTPRLGSRIAVLSSSLLWAVMHLPRMLAQSCPPIPTTVGIITFTVLGAALGTGFLRNDRTLWLPFGLHYGYNLGYSLVGGLATVTNHSPSWWAGHPAWTPESGLSGLLLTAAILVAVWFSQRLIR